LVIETKPLGRTANTPLATTNNNLQPFFFEQLGEARIVLSINSCNGAGDDAGCCARTVVAATMCLGRCMQHVQRRLSRRQIERAPQGLAVDGHHTVEAIDEALHEAGEADRDAAGSNSLNPRLKGACLEMPRLRCY
jgi:hypothetical protein